MVILVFLGVPATLRAQYYSINIDLKTAAAMQAAYSAGAAGEAFYNEQVKSILEHYKGAETAAAAIFSNEYLRRRALTDLGLWESATENWYYRRIYNLVAARIMPKVWTVAGMMLRNPQNALYWGSYLVKVCDETKALCMQFESVVTNSTLSFGDVVFLQIREEIAEVFRLSGIGGVDFKAVLDGFADIGDSLTNSFTERARPSSPPVRGTSPRASSRRATSTTSSKAGSAPPSTSWRTTRPSSKA